MDTRFPKAKSHVTVEEIDDELVVYDLEHHRAHALTPEAAAVWRRCDGRTSFRQIGVQVAGARESSLDLDLILDALRQLDQAGLLESPPGHHVRTSAMPLSPSAGILSSRRVAWAAAGALVTTIALPANAFAQLAGPPGPPGPTGAAGPPGAAGATGPLPVGTGVTGPTGPAGPSGPAGQTGSSGLAGAGGGAGATGAFGATGSTGATGVFGLAGAVGATGATGPTGPAGV